VDDPRITAELLVALAAGQGDRWARLMREALRDPRQMELLFDRLRGYESAVERLLGMRTGILRLYNYDRLRETFAGLTESLDPASPAR
jgi:hypothetical protein